MYNNVCPGVLGTYLPPSSELAPNYPQHGSHPVSSWGELGLDSVDHIGSTGIPAENTKDGPQCLGPTLPVQILGVVCAENEFGASTLDWMATAL